MLWRVMAVEYPSAALVPRWYITAATASTVAQFEPTVGVVILYPPQLFGVQFAVATSHRKILPLPGGSHLYLGLYPNASNFEQNEATLAD
jgi:hypothetical protein